MTDPNDPNVWRDACAPPPLRGLPPAAAPPCWPPTVTAALTAPEISPTTAPTTAPATAPPGPGAPPTPLPPIAPDLILRDPAAALRALRLAWQGHRERWVFGYASLIWRPEFDAAEHRSALLHGWHRALRMRSRVNRGTPQQPGLVFALLPGGACRGVVYRLRAEQAEAELDRLWAREMPTGVYDARLLPCRTPQGPVLALAFTLSRRSEACLPRLPDDEVAHILRHAHGRYGSTLQYLAETAEALRVRGVRDREIERLMALARRQGLI